MSDSHSVPRQISDGGSRTAPFAGEGSAGRVHLLIRALFEMLPDRDAEWAAEGRAKWLRAAAAIFDLVYQEGNEIAVCTGVRERTTEYKIVGQKPSGRDDR